MSKKQFLHRFCLFLHVGFSFIIHISSQKSSLLLFSFVFEPKFHDIGLFWNIGFQMLIIPLCRNSKTKSSCTPEHFPELWILRIMNNFKITIFSFLSSIRGIDCRYGPHFQLKSQIPRSPRFSTQLGGLLARFRVVSPRFIISHNFSLKSF